MGPYDSEDGTEAELYCTPDDVAEALDLPDAYNPQERFQFSDMSHPSYEQVLRMIRSNMEVIDRRLKDSWGTHYVKDRIKDINFYEQDEMTWRGMYYQKGGNSVMLTKDLKEWDPSKGDKLEFRNRLSGQWVDVSDMEVDGTLPAGVLSPGFWFDRHAGLLYLRRRVLTPRYSSIRISYRYGRDEPVPADIQRLCCLMTMVQILQTQPFFIKVGQGGDIGNVRDMLIKSWQDEINTIISVRQKTASVVGLW